MVLDTLCKLGVLEIEGLSAIMNFIGIVVDTKAGKLRILEEKPAYMWRLTVLAGDGCREFESLNGTWFIQPP